MGGFFKGLIRSFVPMLDARKNIKKAGPFIAAAAAMPYGGPAAAVAAAAAVGASQRGKGNKLKGAASGAAKGAAYAAMAPTVAAKFGANGVGADISGLNSPSLLNQLGMSSAPATGGGIGLWGNAGATGLMDPYVKSSTIGSLLKEGISQMGSMHPRTAHSPEQMQQVEAQRPFRPEEEEYAGDGQPEQMMQGEHSFGSHGLSPLETFLSLAPKKKKHSGAVPELIPTEVRRAKGGYVNHKTTGFINVGDTGAADDDVAMKIPNGSYVMNGMDVALLGDGNTINGVKKLTEFEKSIPVKPKSRFTESGITKPYDEHTIRAKVSNGEYVLKPSTVEHFGNGNNTKGAKVIDKMRKNLRAHKGVTKILLPKTKDIRAYVKGGR